MSAEELKTTMLSQQYSLSPGLVGKYFALSEDDAVRYFNDPFMTAAGATGSGITEATYDRLEKMVMDSQVAIFATASELALINGDARRFGIFQAR